MLAVDVISRTLKVIPLKLNLSGFDSERITSYFTAINIWSLKTTTQGKLHADFSLLQLILKAYYKKKSPCTLIQANCYQNLLFQGQWQSCNLPCF